MNVSENVWKFLKFPEYLSQLLTPFILHKYFYHFYSVHRGNPNPHDFNRFVIDSSHGHLCSIIFIPFSIISQHVQDMIAKHFWPLHTVKEFLVNSPRVPEGRTPENNSSMFPSLSIQISMQLSCLCLLYTSKIPHHCSNLPLCRTMQRRPMA